MYLYRRGQSRAGLQSLQGAGATCLESLRGTDFSLALFGAIFLASWVTVSITMEAVIEFHVALG